jgi:hypothetical protein
MDTTVGLKELVTPPGLGLVFLVREGRRVAITGGPNARGVSPGASTAIIQRRRPKVHRQGFITVMMRRPNNGRERFHCRQLLPVSRIVKKQAMIVRCFPIVGLSYQSQNSQILEENILTGMA